MTTTLLPGQSKSYDLHDTTGRVVLQVRVDRHHEGVSINVTQPTKTILGGRWLNDDLDSARTYLQFLYDAVRDGHPVWMIEHRHGALVNAASALTDADEQLIDDINATLDGVTAVHARVAQRLQDDVAAIMADADPNWRAKLRAQVVQAAQPVRRDFTKTRVHCQPLTPAELDLIRSHRDGKVTTKRGQSWTVLRAIVRRGYGEPVYGRGTRIIAVQLNQRGLNAALQVERAA